MSEIMGIPTPLYHYTTQSGLLGIILDRQIWATNVLFLNDSMEVNYAIQLVQENINKFSEERRLNQKETQFFEDFGKKLRIFHNPGYQKYGGVYTCSFSENGDLLSQWRGYCPNGNGFSIGFDFSSSLGHVVEEQYFELVRCEYNEITQVEMINAFLSKALRDFHESKNEDVLDLKVWEDFLSLAPRLKHPNFGEEKEWRVISKPRTVEYGGVNFRPGKSMLIPYVKINLTEYDSNNNRQLKCLNCIPELYIGPTLYPNLSRISLDGLLLREKVHTEDVGLNGTIKDVRSKTRESQISYRIYSA